MARTSLKREKGRGNTEPAPEPAEYAARPLIAPASGDFTDLDPVEVTVTTVEAGGTTYHTTDGSTPTEASTESVAPFNVSPPVGEGADISVRARTFHPTKLPSDIAGAVYHFDAPPPDPGTWLTHAPIRALPTPSGRAFDEGSPDFYMAPNAVGGNGTEGSPWGTFAQAAAGMSPGDTLYLRGGTSWQDVLDGNGIYRNAGSWAKSGTLGNLITVRAYPGEIPVLTGSHQIFFDDPNLAWEEVGDGEFRSVLEYPTPNVASSKRIAAGNFAESMVPLFRYDFINDLRAVSELIDPAIHSNNQNADPGVYCGPGMFWLATVPGGNVGRFHIRLAHTTVAPNDNDYLNRGVLDNNYTGEQDPRNIQLVVVGGESLTPNLFLRGSYTRFQDIVVMGQNRLYIGRPDEVGVEADGLHLYAGPPPHGMILGGAEAHMTNCKVRGFTAPWTNRYTEKNRTDHGQLCEIAAVTAEVDHCEFTDHHDSLPRSGASCLTLDFHHNLCSNATDDGFYQPECNINRVQRVWQNIFSGLGQMFPWSPTNGNQYANPDAGLWMFRNLIDIRHLVYRQPPLVSEAPGTGAGHLGGKIFTMTHGNNAQWANWYFYQNTVLADASGDVGSIGNYLRGLGKDWNSSHRRCYNNIVYLMTGNQPGQNIEAQTVPSYFEGRNNLMWTIGVAPITPTEIDTTVNVTGGVVRTIKSGDIYDDPDFEDVNVDWRVARDVRVAIGSPAINAGYDISTAHPTWPDDPLLPLDESRPGYTAPTIGAIPHGQAATMFGPEATV